MRTAVCELMMTVKTGLQLNLYENRCKNRFAAIEFQCEPSNTICENLKKWDLPGSRIVTPLI